MFELDNTMDIGGTCYLSEMRLSPAALMRVFGNPQDGDGGYKVHGEYAFRGPDGSRWTLYDWKEGYNVWDKKTTGLVSLHIGGDDTRYLNEFREWLANMLNCAK